MQAVRPHLVRREVDIRTETDRGDGAVCTATGSPYPDRPPRAEVAPQGVQAVPVMRLEEGQDHLEEGRGGSRAQDAAFGHCRTAAGLVSPIGRRSPSLLGWTAVDGVWAVRLAHTLMALAVYGTTGKWRRSPRIRKAPGCQQSRLSIPACSARIAGRRSTFGG